MRANLAKTMFFFCNQAVMGARKGRNGEKVTKHVKKSDKNCQNYL